MQIYTANKNVLESQTAQRCLQTPGVLPERIRRLLGTAKEDDAIKETSLRCQKYNAGSEVLKRIEQIKEESKNPRTLFVILMDEAHFNATG